MTLMQGDCLELMRELPANSIDLIATDPPYYKVKGEAWDNQWDTPDLFIAWMGQLCAEWQRILKPNGSLYVFASPKMSARVEVEIGRWFNVLSNIVWNKLSDYPEGDRRATAYRARDHESFRKYFDYSERIIFAEHYGFVFEPLRGYLDSERRRAGVGIGQIRDAMGFSGNMPYHWFAVGIESGKQSQWQFPQKHQYEQMREVLSQLDHGGTYLAREYDDLQAEYEALRRPFSVTPDVPYTDVWTFKTVQAYAGKHPCEKPLELMKHIIRTSSKPGAVVLDCFMGSGATGQAARELGRDFIGMELDAKYFAQAQRRIETAQGALAIA